jgi:hypothetical protein
MVLVHFHLMMDCEHCVANKNTPFAKQAQSLETEIKELTTQKSKTFW